MNVDNSSINTISLCSGVGMLDEGFHAGLGFMGIRSRTVLYAEREAYPVSVLEARMEEGSIHPAPIWFGDFTELPARQFRGVVDCVVAGFPCQDLSVAGRRAGLDGKRSGLFFEVVRIAADCGAWLMLLENVAGIATATASVVDAEEGELDERAASRVVGELADLGWNAEWIVISASDVGASHGRARWFCVAWRKVGHAGHDAGNAEQRKQSEGATSRAGESSAVNDVADTAWNERDGGSDWEARSGRGVCGTGVALDDAMRTERRPLGFGGSGIQQGNDGERQTDCRAGIASEACLGDTGLQHLNLQQRTDGAEHPGTSGTMGHANQQRQQQPNNTDCPEPRCNSWTCSCRAGGELANTSSSRCRRRENARASQSDAITWTRSIKLERDRSALADSSIPRPQRHKQSSTHEQDGRTDGRTDGAGIMPINYRISS